MSKNVLSARADEKLSDSVQPILNAFDLPVNNGLIIGALYYLTWEYIRHVRKVQHFETAYWAERRGRARVELEMKKLTEVQLNTSEGFFVQPIGHIKSCYRQCVGTPRQGMLVPSSRASIVLTNNMSPESLDGLEEFSHVWLTFKFHLNTNILKEAKAFAGATTDSKRYTFTGKITPPMLKEKKGVLATRSPHRPNPVGVTLARVERVDKKTRTVHLSACDLVQGTPVLDMKPYVPNYDTVEPCKIPQWILETIDTRNTVLFAPEAVESARSKQLSSKLKQYKNQPDLYLQAVRETLEADVRSKFQTKRRQEDAKKGILVEVPFDNTTVKFLWRDERVLEVVEIVRTTDEEQQRLIAELQKKDEKYSEKTEGEKSGRTGDNGSQRNEQKIEEGRTDGEDSLHSKDSDNNDDDNNDDEQDESSS